MENTAPHSSCISWPASVSAGESSWAMHFAGFLASSAQGDRQGGGGASESSFSSGYSSSFDSLGDDDGSFITSDMVCDDEDEDDSLQDTACSSTTVPKQVASIHDMKSMVTMDAKEMNTAQLPKYFLDAGSWQLATAGAAQEVISGGNSIEKQPYECNDLRKKGLCLVPVAMLIGYLR
ncbi:unnamed protein product [Alopecurus aequalis]